MSTNPMPSLGSHLAPTNANNSSFADTHEVHYAPSYNFSTGATVHSQQYDNSAYRPGSRTPISLYGGPGGAAMSAAAPPVSSVATPVYNHQPPQADNRELNGSGDTTPTVTTATSEDGTSSNRSSANGDSSAALRPPSEANVGHDYQVLSVL